ncbi:electron transfer flavoprotein subunit beta/FixA family protein [Shimazuella sp. AN120528]|uniref:electron transfer flavoprotein subunit beta/FixA family protein n=1 Tax=Shimazuella soli TaxID=1892854 RepID=UPI001F0DFCEB|nr:electron transfer flavoprotein subunit beta/FixA family protein [Shimazuella soli]MCH5584508.1 electron transfer flavoprotein subunit beta/FixA family protein [Shimazuella soli]
MNFLVCLKQTFDTEEKIVLKNGQISEEAVEFIINPYDEYAVEEAIRLKEKHGGEITVLTIGPDRTEQALRSALAMGADKAILVETEELEVELDEHSISQVIYAVLQEQDDEFDLILCGYMAVDDGSAQVGPRLAQLLQIPHVSTITSISVDGKNAAIEKDVEGDTEHIQTTLPLLVTTQQGLNDPRYPTIPGIMKAKRKPLTRYELDDLSLSEETIQSKTTQKEIFLPPKKTAGLILTGSIEEQVTSLIEKLNKEAKVL